MMKRMMFCIAMILLGMAVVSCTGNANTANTPSTTDTSNPPEVPTDDATEPSTKETTEAETVEAETVEAETTEEETTEEETTEAIFDPMAFEPTELPAANVAREGFFLASACMTENGYSNTYLNDGDRATGFSTPWDNADATKEYSVFVDLTEVRVLDSVKLYPMVGDEGGFPKAFDILVSMDGESYTNAATVTDATTEAAKDGLSVSLGGVQGQFVKLVTRELGEGAEGKGKYLSLSEMEVYSPIDTATNLMLNRNDIWLFKNPDTTQQLSILYYRDGTAVDPAKVLRYISLDTAVATVDENGLITPVAVGKTDVYVTDGINLAVCHVEVKEETRQEFRVSAFYHSNFAYPEEHAVGLKILAEGGVEYIEDTRDHDRAGNHISMYALYLCNKLGIAYSPRDPLGGPNYLNLTDDEIIAVVQKYENRAGFYGVYLQDEPHEEYISYARIFRIIQEYNPHLIPHLNLLPPYNFAGVDEYFTEFAAVAGGNGRMRYLTYDHYPFLWGNSFDGKVYSSLNRLRQAGLFFNADTGFYMQSMVMTGGYPLLNADALRYNATLGMAYGMKNYKWFVALTPVDDEKASFETGFVGPDFKPAGNYAGIIATNKYIKNLGVILGNSDAIEVYHTNSELDNLHLPEDFIFAHVDGGDAIYTVYESLDDSRLQHVLITNKSFRMNQDTTFTVKLQKDVGALSVFDPLTGETTAISVGADSTFTLTLKPGQCVAVILPEGADVSRPDPEQSENLALNKPVFASSSAASFQFDECLATYFLTDGIPENGGWIGSETDLEPWIKLDLLDTYEVSRVKIIMSEAIAKKKWCKSFTVLVSEDGVNYTEIADVKEHKWTSDSGNAYEITFDKTNVRYIRIECNTNRPMAFGELEVYK